MSGGLLMQRDAAPLVGVSVRTLWNYVAQGIIPPAAVVRVGKSGRRRFRRDVLERAGLIRTETPAPVSVVQA